MVVAQKSNSEIRPGVFVVGEPFNSNEAAHLGLKEKVDSLIAHNEFPGAPLRVRGDIAVLSPIPGSGGEEQVLAIEPHQRPDMNWEYVIITSDDIPDYLRN